MSYFEEKTAALTAGKTWPPPRKAVQPAPGHEWEQQTDQGLGGLSVWYCRRCARSVLDLQKPPSGLSGGCRKVAR